MRWTGTVTPTGSVTFTSGGSTIGSSAVDSVGIATLTILLASSSESVTATYSGGSSYVGWMSAIITVNGGPVTQFAMQLTVQSKQHGTTTLTMMSVHGFTAPSGWDARACPRLPPVPLALIKSF